MSASIKTAPHTYEANGTTLRGYMATPDDGASHPGVMVIHEWWGLDDYIRRRADMLAELGYCALAVDMYGDGKTGGSPDEAAALMNGVLGDMDTGAARLRAGLAALGAHPQVDAHRTAAIGYCFGGAMVLHMARTGMDVKAVVSFHGALGSFHNPGPGEVTAKVLVCHGAADSLVPDEQVTAFKAEMDAAGADYRFVAYEGALHGFTNPEATGRGEKYGLPLAYDESTDRESWQAMQDLFARAL